MADSPVETALAEAKALFDRLDALAADPDADPTMKRHANFAIGATASLRAALASVPSRSPDAVPPCDREGCDSPMTGYDAWGQWCDEHNGGLVRSPDARMAVRYDGCFELAWLADGEVVSSAGDGSGAAVVTHVDGTETCLNVGDLYERAALARSTGDGGGAADEAISAKVVERVSMYTALVCEQAERMAEDS